MNVFVIFGLSALGLFLLMGFVYAILYKKVPKQGMMMVINGLNKVTVTKTGGMVIPRFVTYELLDITDKKIVLVRKASKGNQGGEETEGLLCRDNILTDVRVAFYIKINANETEVKDIIMSLGSDKIGNGDSLSRWLTPKLSEALKTAAKEFDFEELYTEREKFKEAIKKIIGDDLHSFVLEDVAIDELNQSPLEAHDPDNILQAQGILKITTETVARKVLTNDQIQNSKTEIKAKDVSAESARLQLDKDKADAIAKNDREVRIITANEDATAKKSEEDSRLIVAKASIKTDEQIGIETVAKDREIKTSTLKADEVTGIQAEKVERAKEVEKVITAQDVAIKNADKELAVEKKAKEVADVTSERVEVEKKIAIAEEATLDVRTQSGAEREKKVIVVSAEANAESKHIERIQEASAGLKVAEFYAEETQIKAGADLIAKEKEAIGIEKLADGKKADFAAEGLAQVLVDTASAESIKLKGFAEAEVKEKDASATRALGEVEAMNTEEMGVAVAKGEEAKYIAMGKLSPEDRAHDKLKIETDKDIQIRQIEVDGEVKLSGNNALVLAKGLEHANIDIIGGEQTFFNQLTAAVVDGKAVDRKFDNSEVMNSLVSKYRSGEGDLPADIKDVLQKTELSTGALGAMTLAQIMANPDAKNQVLSMIGMVSK